MAITSGSLPVTPEIPIGHVILASRSRGTPRASSRFSNWRRFDCEPIKPK